jgi:hypothetical protein
MRPEACVGMLSLSRRRVSIPQFRGFLAGWTTRETLSAGTRISRYGGEGGTLISPQNVPFSARGLPPEAARGPYSVYEVVEPPTVDAGIAAPAFGWDSVSAPWISG